MVDGLLTESEVMNLKFHEKTGDKNVTVIRVLGGWIYTIPRLDHGQMNSVFVPESSKERMNNGSN